MDLSIGAFGDLVHVVQREILASCPEMDSLQQPSAFELLANVRGVARHDDAVAGRGAGVLVARRRDPRFAGRSPGLRRQELRQRRGQIGEARGVDGDSVTSPLDLVPRLSEPPVVARTLVVVGDDGFGRGDQELAELVALAGAGDPDHADIGRPHVGELGHALERGPGHVFVGDVGVPVGVPPRDLRAELRRSA